MTLHIPSAIITRPVLSARCVLLAALAGALLLALSSAGPASAEGAAWWRIGSEVAPTHLPPEARGKPGQGEIVLTMSDLGDAPVDASAEHPVTVTYKLPPGLTATSVSSPYAKCPSGAPANPVVCTITSIVQPYTRLAIAVQVRVSVAAPAGTATTLQAEASVEGGGAPSVSSTQRLTVSEEPAPLGVQEYEFSLYNEDGTPDTRAQAEPLSCCRPRRLRRPGSRSTCCGRRSCLARTR